MLLLEFGRVRHESGKNFCLAIEEPELHLPPGSQRRIVYRTQGLTDQTVVTSHSPAVAGFFPGTNIRLLHNDGGVLRATSLLGKPLHATSSNAVRKLFQQSRQETIEALMHEVVLVPEGRLDFEWLRRLISSTETREGWDLTGEGEAPFGTLIGVIPTHEASVNETYEVISSSHARVVVLVDGDSAGDGYLSHLRNLARPPRAIVQWPHGFVLEHVLTWILKGGGEEGLQRLSSLLGIPLKSYDDFLERLLIEGRKGGIKDNLLVHDLVLSHISDTKPCLLRAGEVLRLLCCIARDPHGQYEGVQTDRRSITNCPIRIISL